MKYIKTYEGLFDFFRKRSLTKSDIKKICDKYRIRDYKINDDLSIDVFQNVELSMMNLKKIPLVFNRVEGNFDISFNKLASLDGSPRYVSKIFKCNHCELKSLKGGPDKTYDYRANDNQLTTMEFCGEIQDNADFDSNKIYTWEFVPSPTSLFMDHNPLEFIPISINTQDGTRIIALSEIYSLSISRGWLDILNDCDPIREPDAQSNGKPIIYLDRLNQFYEAIGAKTVKTTSPYYDIR